MAEVNNDRNDSPGRHPHALRCRPIGLTVAALLFVLGATFSVAQPGRPLGLRLADPADMPKPDYVKAAATTPDGDVAVALLHSDTIEVDGEGTALPGTGIDGGVIVYDHRTGAVRSRFSFGGSAPRVVPHGLVVDADGAFVVIGYAGGVGASTVDLGGGPVSFTAAEVPFVARFDAKGRLLWSHVLHGRDGSRPARCEGTNCDRAWDVALAPDGRIVVVGGFSGRLRLPRGELESAGDSDIFVLVLSRAGEQTAAWRIGGPAAEGGRQGFGAAPGGLGEMALAVAGERIFVQGTFGPDAEFGGTGSGARVSPANGRRDVFVARYTLAGTLDAPVWTAGVAADPNGPMAAPGAMAVDSQGTIYLALRLPAVSAAPTRCVLPPGAAQRTLVLSLDKSLACRWATPLAFSGGGIHRTVIDGRGAVYVAGWFSGSHTFPNRTLQARSALSDVFVAKLDALTGVPRWGAGLVSVESASANNIAAGLAIDAAGSPWIGGQYFTDLELAQPGQASFVLRTAYRGEPSPRSGDGFVARFDPDTGRLR